jgi:eukaryotic-like serine/threonine-protein kinase
MSAMHGTSGVDASPVHGYEIVRTLSEGGMSKVYLARQHALNRLVCVKVMSIPEGEDADLCRARFCREAELLASVSHPHILSIFDFGATVDQGLPFLVTEYIEGGDLRRRMSRGQAMPAGEARSILLQVGDALTFLHEKGILHRDLKPENILMPTDSLAKLGDFGIAVMQQKAGVLTDNVRGMGTVGYVSPEQQYGLKVDERADEYSLAALSYELLTGRRPLGLFPPPSRVNPQLTRKLDAVILRGLAEEPKHRFPSVREFVTAYGQALDSSSQRGRSLRLALFGLIVIFFVVAGLGWVAGVGWKHDVQIGERAAPPVSLPNPAAANRLGPQDARKPGEPPASAPEPSPEFKRLVELRAYAIWVHRGRPTGLAGEAVKEENWLEAERQIRNEIKARAFQLWDKQGRPTGEAGEAVREKNTRAAEAELLEETEDELRRHPID